MSVSYSECLIFEAIKSIFPDAQQTVKDNPIILSPRGFHSEIDILVPSLNLAIEYDGFKFHNNPKAHETDQFKAFQISRTGMTLLHVREENLPILFPEKNMTVLEVPSDYSDQAMKRKCVDVLSFIKKTFPDRFPDTLNLPLPDFDTVKNNAQQNYNNQNREIFLDIVRINVFYRKHPNITSNLIHKGTKIYDSVQNIKEKYSKGYLSSKIISNLNSLDPSILAPSLIHKRTDTEYNRIFVKARAYFQDNGNLWIPSTHKDKELLDFVKEARKNINNPDLSDDLRQKYLMLQKIDPKVFFSDDQIWKEKYQMVKKTIDEKGSIYAILATPEYNQINAWIQEQDYLCKSKYLKYSWGIDRIEKLKDLDDKYFTIAPDATISEWLKMYRKLSNFDEINGHTFVPMGQNRDTDELHEWVKNQRLMYNTKSGIFSPDLKLSFSPENYLCKINPMFFAENEYSETGFTDCVKETKILSKIIKELSKELINNKTTPDPEKTLLDVCRRSGYQATVEQGRNYHNIKVVNNGSEVQIPVPNSNSVEILRCSPLLKLHERINNRFRINKIKFRETGKAEKDILWKTFKSLGFTVKDEKDHYVISNQITKVAIRKDCDLDKMESNISQKIKNAEQKAVSHNHKTVNKFHK